MTKSERENWIINIENTASAIIAQVGKAVVNAVFKRYGVKSLWDLNSNHLADIFNELYALENDLK